MSEYATEMHRETGRKAACFLIAYRAPSVAPPCYLSLTHAAFRSPHAHMTGVPLFGAVCLLRLAIVESQKGKRWCSTSFRARLSAQGHVHTLTRPHTAAYRTTNFQIFFLFGILILLSLISAIASFIWRGKNAVCLFPLFPLMACPLWMPSHKCCVLSVF